MGSLVNPRSDKDGKVSLLPSKIEPRFLDHPARSLVTTPTDSGSSLGKRAETLLLQSVQTSSGAQTASFQWAPAAFRWRHSTRCVKMKTRLHIAKFNEAWGCISTVHTPSCFDAEVGTLHFTFAFRIRARSANAPPSAGSVLEHSVHLCSTVQYEYQSTTNTDGLIVANRLQGYTTSQTRRPKYEHLYSVKTLKFQLLTWSLIRR
jgi:hypothetical protein